MSPFLTLALTVLALAAAGNGKLLGFLTGNKGVQWNTLEVKYDLLMNGYYRMPLKISDIRNNEFVLLGSHEEFTSAKIYCYPDDPRVCLIYDSHGNIAGLRVAYIIKDLMNKGKGFLPYSYDKPIFKKGSAFGQEFYYIDVLTISPASLSMGGIAKRTELVGTGVYLNIDGHWAQMPRKEEDTKDTLFTKQACFPGMGMHYFYNMTPQMECENHQPPFLLYDGGYLIGLGLIPFGSFTSKKRVWFEDPPKMVINTIVPKAPKCLEDWVGKYGTTSIHIFFKSCNRLTCIPILGSLFWTETIWKTKT